MTILASNSHRARVRVEVQKRALLRERLLSEIPDLDETTLMDTLDGCSDLKEMLAAVIRSALDDEAMAEALGARLQDMKRRLERYQVRAGKARDIVLAAMNDGGIAKLVEPDFTASLRSGAVSVEVVSEKNVPPAFWKPQPPKLDRAALLNALKMGNEVAGAVLSEPKLQLSVRTK